VSLICCSCMEREKAHRDTPQPVWVGGDGFQARLRGALADRLVVVLRPL